MCAAFPLARRFAASVLVDPIPHQLPQAHKKKTQARRPWSNSAAAAVGAAAVGVGPGAVVVPLAAAGKCMLPACVC